MNLILDIGNTRIKAAIFEQFNVVHTCSFLNKELAQQIQQLQKKYQPQNLLISIVGKKNGSLKEITKSFQKVIHLTSETKVPFRNLYKSPTTLGVDRIGLAASAAVQYAGKNCLIIDAGTCITYDFMSAKGSYLGGAISLGIQMRFKALHAYTANLPELEIDHFSLIGKNTNESIYSGVLNGVLQELTGVIAQYEHKYPNLTVVLTGGDANYLAKKLKSTIFANPNFLLEGLNSILIHNLDE